MKMLQRSLASPCPIFSSTEELLNIDMSETTSTINFTMELDAAFRNARPKKLQRQPVPFAIHEDSSATSLRSSGPRKTLLQPPRRIQIVRGQQEPSVKNSRSSCGTMVDLELAWQRQQDAVSHSFQVPGRSTTQLSTVLESAPTISNVYVASPATEVLRPARRGTIYIPNEDTTMPSMYMGIFSPVKAFSPSAGGTRAADTSFEMTGIAAQMATKKAGRKSTMGGAPRRGVLQSSDRPVQATSKVKDRHGQGDGKENIPPGAVSNGEVRPSANRKIMAVPSDMSTGQSKKLQSMSNTSLRRATPRVPSQETQSTLASNKGSRLGTPKPTPVVKGSSRSPLPESSDTTLSKSRVPTRFVVSNIRAQRDLQSLAVLQEDVKDSSMYEENWLQHQEIVVTQLVNSLFSACEQNAGHEHDSIRKELLHTYCSTPVALMHKRLQAALLYGSLGIPQDTLDQGARLQNDVGLRKRFTDLWMCTYDLDTLATALEVVVGLECRTGQLNPLRGNLHGSKSSKTTVRTYIEAFLIRNEDAKPGAKGMSEVTTRAAWSYQRTLVRSLMLIKLLDLTKSEQNIGIKGLLFQRSSSYKSSSLVVQALFQMLNPAAGDPIRALNHINYSVSHNQRPLEEFDFHVQNLAVDLRDGIRLTRIVELLLYSSSLKSPHRSTDGTTTALLVPDSDETIEFELKCDQAWPVSQHLKFPSQNRAVRVWNVQLALSAIGAAKGLGSLISGIRAQDIVDGFREKTMRLLWALLGKWGLSGLFDVQDLKWEVRRLTSNAQLSPYEDMYDNEFDDDDLSFATCKALLRRWSRSVAASHGFEVRNFTTSFADGKAFEAIISEYEPYLCIEDHNKRQRLSLQNRLIRLGCSVQFSQLFAETKEIHIFDRDFVLAALAFLCSRLLPPSRRSRAATVIQRAWRRCSAKYEASRKHEKKRIALACAEFVASKLDTSNNRDSTENKVSLDSPKLRSPTSTHGKDLLMSPVELSGHEDIWLTL